jgi:hypothetical protein
MDKLLGMLPIFPLWAWKQYLSFLACDNKANRTQPEILGAPCVYASANVSQFRFLGNPG